MLAHACWVKVLEGVLGGEQGGWWGVSEVGEEGFFEEREQVAAVLAAGGDSRPDALAPVSASFATSALRDAAVDHDVANGLLGGVVGRLKISHVREA